MSEAISVARTQAPDIPLPAELAADVVVLPRQIGEDGRALYHDSVITFVKEFTGTDATAAFAHDQASRGWIGEKGLQEIAINLVVAIAGGGGWAGLSYVLGGKYRSARVRVKAGRCRQTQSGTTWEWYEVDGSGADVAKALMAIKDSEERPEQLEQEAETQTDDGSQD